MGLSVYLQNESEKELYWGNITHNLNKMADAAGIYQHLWRPEEIGIVHAHQLIEPLTKGLEDLKQRPEHYSQYDSPNGWGLYVHFVPFVENYLKACIEHPQALVYACR